MTPIDYLQTRLGVRVGLRVLVVLVALGIGACSMEKREAIYSTQRLVSSSTAAALPVDSGEHTPPLRLALAAFENVKDRETQPMRFSADQIKTVREAPSASQSPDSVSFDYTAEQLVFRLESNIDARMYDTIRLRLRVEKSKYFLLWFRNVLMPPDYEMPYIVVPTIPDGRFHDYEIALNDRHQTYWLGHVLEVSLRPESWEDTVEFGEITFARGPADAPDRLNFHGQTHEVFYGTQAPWTFTVPPGGSFSTYVCNPTSQWFPPVNLPVAFRVVLNRPNGLTVVLAEQKVDPGRYSSDNRWRFLEASLEPYRGERVQLQLQVLGEGDAAAGMDQAGAWGSPMVTSREPSEATPVILISCDTLRADHLGCYGYGRDTSPVLDAFAQEAVLFENAVVDVPSTLPSHMSLMTGLHRNHHEVDTTYDLPESRTTLAEMLRQHGYVTGGFTGHGYLLAPWRGFDQGFDLYATPAPPREGFLGVSASMELVKNWVDNHAANNVFLFFHTYEVHAKFEVFGYRQPYIPSESRYLHFGAAVPGISYQRPGFEDACATHFLQHANSGEIQVTPEEREHLIACYDDGIRMVDDQLGGLFDALRRAEIFDNAIIVFIADHGEAFREHGLYLHGQVYEPLLRVPLLIRFPHARHGGTRVKSLVTNQDILPTIADELGIAPDFKFDGQSLLDVLAGKVRVPEQAFFAFQPATQGIRTNRWKLILDPVAGVQELYDLEDDPAETRNLHTDMPDVVAALEPRVHAFFQPKPGWRMAITGEPSDATLRLHVVSDAPIKGFHVVDVELDGPYLDDFELDRSRRYFTANLRMYPNDRDQFRLAGAEGSIEVFVHTDAGQPVRVISGTDDIEIADRGSVVLDSANPALETEPAAPDGGDGMVLRIWHSTDDSAQQWLQQLPEEDQQRMKDLGYL